MAAKNLATYTGTLHEVLPLQTFSSGFKKQDFILKTVNGEYTDYAKFTAKKDACDKVALLKAGAEVTVTYRPDAHEWNGPKGKTWFSDCLALKIEIGGVNAGSLNAGSAAPSGAPEQMTIDEAIADDIPF